MCTCNCTLCIAQLPADIFSWTGCFHDLLVCGFATSTDCFSTSVPSSKEPLIAKPSFFFSFPLLSLCSLSPFLSSFLTFFFFSPSFFPSRYVSPSILYWSRNGISWQLQKNQMGWLWYTFHPISTPGRDCIGILDFCAATKLIAVSLYILCNWFNRWIARW